MIIWNNHYLFHGLTLVNVVYSYRYLLHSMCLPNLIIHEFIMRNPFVTCSCLSHTYSSGVRNIIFSSILDGSKESWEEDGPWDPYNHVTVIRWSVQNWRRNNVSDTRRICMWYAQSPVEGDHIHTCMSRQQKDLAKWIYALPDSVYALDGGCTRMSLIRLLAVHACGLIESNLY